MSDNNDEVKILTYKSGQFVFSAKHRKDELSALFIQSKVLYAMIAGIPILPSLATKIEEDLIRKSIFSTAAIEGNSLSEERVKEILSNVSTDKNITKNKKEVEISNLKQAYSYVQNLPIQKDGFILTEEIVNKIHLLVTQNIDYNGNLPGKYRNHLVKVNDAEHGGVDVPPKIYEDIKMLMDEFFKWINNSNMKRADPIIRAALGHYYLARIHPFADGNGRTARLVEALLLFQTGIKYVPVMLSNYYYYHIDDYFRAFASSIKNKENDVTDFLTFVLNGHIESQNAIKDKIFNYIRKFTLREYYRYLRKDNKISQRELDFLNSLLDVPKKFALNEINEISGLNIIYRNVGERTLRRDLDKMHSMKLILKEENKYSINLHLLG